MTITDEQIEEIKARVDAATPGPWWTSAKYNEEECGVCVIAANENCGPLPTGADVFEPEDHACVSRARKKPWPKQKMQSRGFPKQKCRYEKDKA